MILRPYQQAAVDAVYNHLRTRDDNPCVVIPTGGGKTPVIATICRDAVVQWGGRVLVVAHVKELLQQAADKLRAVCPEVDVGVYSAGLGRRQTQQPVIVAGVQSVFKRAHELGAFNLVIVDEAHLIPPDGEGMYQTLIAGLRRLCTDLRIIGLTATPFRLSTGVICAPENILNSVCYEVGVKELIRDGFLCVVKSKATGDDINTQNLHVRGGEFVQGEVEDLMDTDELVKAACTEIARRTVDRKSILVFCASVKHANNVAAGLTEHGIDCATVFGDTTDADREQAIQNFKAGRLKCIVNVNVLTTGFDAPNVDCVVLLRPTMSPGLYYQMVGRGFRLCDGKGDCLILDFGGNVLRHGPVDALIVKPKSGGGGEPPAKKCPACLSVISAGYSVCPDCGYVFETQKRNQHGTQATNESVLSGDVTEKTYEVLETRYSEHVKKGAPDGAPKTLRVDYTIALGKWVSEWVCVEHGGIAGIAAKGWWSKRTVEPMPSTAAEAAEIGMAGLLKSAQRITVRTISGEKYPKIMNHEFREYESEIEPEYVMAKDDIPF